MSGFLSPGCLAARRAVVLDTSCHADRMAAERHLDWCEACRLFMERERATAERLKVAASWERSSRREVGRVPVVLLEPSPRRGRWRQGRSLAALAALVLVGSAALGTLFLRRDRAGAVEAMFLDHLHYLQVAQPAYLVTSDPSVIETWSRREFSFSPRIARPEGFDLLGARRCSVAGRQVALVFYQRGPCHASLFIGDTDGWTDLPRVAGWRGMTLISHVHQHLVYAAVGDLPQEELDKLLPSGSMAPRAPKEN